MSRKHVPDIMVCLACWQYRQDIETNNGSDKWPYDYLMEWSGECLKVCYRAMERAEEHGYITYSVSLRTGWLTHKGEDLLRNAANLFEAGKPKAAVLNPDWVCRVMRGES